MDQMDCVMCNTYYYTVITILITLALPRSLMLVCNEYATMHDVNHRRCSGGKKNINCWPRMVLRTLIFHRYHMYHVALLKMAYFSIKCLLIGKH